MTRRFVFSTLAIFFIATREASAHGATLWYELLCGLPQFLVVAAVSVFLGARAKRRLIRRQLFAAESIPWEELIPSLLFEVAVIGGLLPFTSYIFEKWLWAEADSTLFGAITILLGNALLSSLLMIIFHARLLTRKFNERGRDISPVKKFGLAFQLGLVNPSVFAAVAGGLAWVLS